MNLSEPTTTVIRPSATRRMDFAWAKGVGGIVAAGALWEMLRFVGVLPPQWAPSLADIGGALVTNLVDGTWVEVVGSTAAVWLAGLLIGSVIGFVWGAGMGVSSWTRAASGVVVAFLRPVPSVALIPIAILILGTRPQMVLVLVIFGAIWPVLFNTLYAFRELPAEYADTARSLGYGAAVQFWRVRVVAALPGVFTGVRTATSIALVIAVSVELIVGTSGLGAFIQHARTSGQIADAYAGILVGGILGVGAAGILALLQRRLLAWSPENRDLLV